MQHRALNEVQSGLARSRQIQGRELFHEGKEVSPHECQQAEAVRGFRRDGGDGRPRILGGKVPQGRLSAVHAIDQPSFGERALAGHRFRPDNPASRVDLHSDDQRRRHFRAGEVHQPRQRGLRPRYQGLFQYLAERLSLVCRAVRLAGVQRRDDGVFHHRRPVALDSRQRRAESHDSGRSKAPGPCPSSTAIEPGKGYVFSHADFERLQITVLFFFLGSLGPFSC